MSDRDHRLLCAEVDDVPRLLRLLANHPVECIWVWVAWAERVWKSNVYTLYNIHLSLLPLCGRLFFS